MLRLVSSLRRGLLPLAALLLAWGAAQAQAPAADEAPDVLYSNGLRAFNGGDYATAVANFQRLISLFGNEAELQGEMESVFYALGCSLYNQGVYPEAIKTFQEYAKRFPKAKFLDEAAFRIASAHQIQEAYPEAVAEYQRLIATFPNSLFVEDAGYQIAICRIIEERNNDAIAALEAFTRSFPNSEFFAQAKVYLARAYFQAGRLEDALGTLDTLQSLSRNLDHLVYANFLAIEIGDAAFDNTDYDMALRAYRRVRTKAALLKLQRRLAAGLQDQLAQLVRSPIDPQQLSARFRQERRLRSSLAAAQSSVQKLEGMAEYDSALFHRIGRCFYAVDRFWEARVAFQRVVRESQDATLREAGHFDLVLALNRLRRFPELIGEGDRYLGAFGQQEKLLKNGRVGSVSFMRAEAFVNQELFEEAEREMAALLEKFPDHPQRPRIEFYLALSLAMQERYDDAITRFESWLRAHPDESLRAEVEYWLPVALYYDGRYADALPLLADYALRYPLSIYAPEAEYRAALCKYSLERFAEAAADLEGWIARHPDHVFRWEAQVTRGDAAAAAGDLQAARLAYRAVTPEAGAYHFFALKQLTKVYKALDTPDDYREMAAVFADYIRQNPESPQLVEAAYEAGWALRRVGRTDEARRLYWSIIERYGNNRAWDGFGPMLEDVRKLYSDQPEQALRQDLQRVENAARGLGQATLVSRLVLAQMRWNRREPGEAAQELIKRFRPDQLDADALAFAGEGLVRGPDRAQGVALLERLLQDFPKSPLAAVAYTRRAEAALAQGDTTNALALAEASIDRPYDPVLLMESTFARAEALRAMGRAGDAIADYNAVVANRITPRALKPRALLGLGACQEAQGDYRKAIPFYQRIYVMYRAYTDAVVEAYLRSGAAFERIKDRQAAANTYREMLGLESLAGRPELEEARARLARLES